MQRMVHRWCTDWGIPVGGVLRGRYHSQEEEREPWVGTYAGSKWMGERTLRRQHVAYFRQVLVGRSIGTVIIRTTSSLMSRSPDCVVA